jgi:hypothetical protein
MKMRDQIDLLERQVEDLKSAFEDIWGTLSLYLSEEQLESVKSYHSEEFSLLEGRDE